MPNIDLTPRQRRTLTELVNEFQEGDSPISAKDLAIVLDREPGTLRNQMMTLQSLNLVEGISGPAGGYKPTSAAYEVLGRQPLAEAEAVTLARNYDRVDATVSSIDFTSVHNPDLCQAQVRFRQSVQEFAADDSIAIGPTPLSSLVIAGVVVAVTEAENTVIVDVKQLEAPLREGQETV